MKIKTETSSAPLIGDVLRARARATPEKLAYTFMAGGSKGIQEDRMTFGELDRSVSELSDHLCRKGRLQDRAILFFQPGLQYIRAFFACLRAGIIAVPAYPPRLHREQERHLQRLATVIADAQPNLALTDAAFFSQLTDLLPKYPNLARLQWIIVDEVAPATGAAPLPEIREEHIAFLQYTSGSTSAPKGVMVSHGNLMANEVMIHEAFGTTETSTCVGWLPLYHDMGLIGNVIQPLFAGFTCHLMSPSTFIRNPYIWLDRISRTGAEISGGPNFAYEICSHKVSEEQMEALDLSSWRIAFNGSEPIREETLARFSEKFARCGFRPSAHYPCYGLAEATLMVSVRGAEGLQTGRYLTEELSRHRAAPALAGDQARTLVSSGVPHGSGRVVIVSPHNRQRLQDGDIGEIWVSGPHIAKGYWKRPDANEETFGAHTSDTGEGPFMRTGDLGFFQEGELFITGRLKELIIIRGRNHSPHDIERTVQSSHPGLRPDAGAAFTIEFEGEPKLVLVQEIERTHITSLEVDAVIDAARMAVSEMHEVHLHTLVLVKPATIPKTTSGKIRRRECQRLFSSGKLDVLATHRFEVADRASAARVVPTFEALSAAGESERWQLLMSYVLGLSAEILDIAAEHIASDRSLGALGLDSLAAIELVQRLRDDLGVDYPLNDLLSGPTPDSLVSWLMTAPREVPAEDPGQPDAAPQGSLSVNQSALWLVQQLSPESPALNISIAVRLRQSPDRERLASALTKLAQRHPMLRTVFTEEDGNPAQTILPQAVSELAFVDAGDWDDAALRNNLDHSAGQPLDLATRPWLLTLYQIGPSESILLLTIHHIVADLWSLQIFFNELGQLYEDPEQLPPPGKVTYEDFVAQQHRRLAGKPGEDLWSWWQRELKTEPPTLALPTDRPRPATFTQRGRCHDFRLGAELAKEIARLAAAHETTPYTFLLAVWMVLLHRYSGQEEFCVGSPTAGRLDARFAKVIGDFVNPIVLRSDLSGKPEFATLLARVRKTVVGCLAHQEFPFELLVERMCPNRDPSFSPLFQTMFSWQKTQGFKQATPFILADRDAVLELGGLEMTPFPLMTRGAQVDLSLIVVDDEYMPARLVFNSDLFDPETAARLTNYYRNLLVQAVREPASPIHRWSLMSSVERTYLLQNWNDTGTVYDRRQTIHDLFENAVARNPRKEILIYGKEGDGDHSLTYAELDRRANLLARQLRERGVGPDVLVGLCLNRTPTLVIALLAVLKAGGTYVPIDPNHPTSRTRLIMEDAGMVLMIAEEALKPTLETEGVSLFSPADFAAADPREIAWPAPDPMNLAYVIYTSGSTGRPKGVQLSHAVVVNFLQSMAVEPGIEAEDVMLAVTTISFDIAVLELYLPLLFGARLVLASSDEVSDGAALVDNIRRNRVTLMQATPSTWRMLLDASFQGPLKALCGGEALPAQLARDMLAVGVSLWNMYGPTETTVWSAVRKITRAGSSPVEPLGGAIANTRLYVLDPDGEPVPIGVAGELHIAGDGLARGYFARPGLTALAFRPDPFAAEAGAGPGCRLYKTGDLVRLRTDGSIDFISRLDYQVKLRGFRIEIGEIEASLNRHPDIREGVVTLRGEGEDDRRLVAYLTLHDRSELAGLAQQNVALASRVRAHLRQTLPDYMVPSHFVVLEAMPQTPNNKVDRKALPAPRASTEKETPDPALLSGVGAVITEVWRELLQVESVGPNDNFFDLGGHSMLLSQANNRLKKRLGVPLTMVEMFQFPTVGALTAHLQGKTDLKIAPANGKRLTVGNQAIAVVGAACRFPGASDVAAFWRNLSEGVCSVIPYSDEQLRTAGVDDTLLEHPDYVKQGAFLDDAESFDASFFDLSPLDASLIDPQQRVFMEICWQALESAGYNPDTYPGAVGVFAGSGMNTYLSNNLLTNQDLVETEGEYRLMTTNDKDFMATRVAYKLNLRGPAINVQTACSTSLVAVHEACQSLSLGECDMALAGGATIRVPGQVGYLYRDGLVFSPDGFCRAFDKRAGGTVPGSGAGVVLLKRLDDALADGDDIWAVIKGSAINNDASQKVGYTAPGVAGQRTVIAAAHAAAGVNPETISYVEAHGTGTRMGDPIEIAALDAAFRMQTSRKGFCAVGSVKTNIGHLDTAAGVAGLIKVVLSLKHGTLPASLHFQEPNPEIDFDASPFFVNTRTRAWETPDDQPRRAGISSFGIGGTNVHAVLEQAPAQADRKQASARPISAEDHHLLLLSARSAAGLEAVTANMATYLERNADRELAPVAEHLAQKKGFEHRRFAVCGNSGDAARVFGENDARRVFSRREEQRDRPLAFLFPGQGAQYPGMTRDFYRFEPEFKAIVDDCCQTLAPLLGLDLRHLLYPEPGMEDEAADKLQQTQFTQPALFIVEFALASLLRHWGLVPRAMVGHSVGEYVAATLAGVFSLEDALLLVAERGRLIASLPPGDMLSVSLSEEEVSSHLSEDLCLAAVNAPNLCVVSGPVPLLSDLENSLKAMQVAVRRLRTSHAFHSSMMDPVLEPFARKFNGLTLHPPGTPIISNLDGSWLKPERATDPQYWVDHLRHTVRFADGLELLFKDEASAILEVGPGNVLTSLARKHPQRGSQRVFVNLLPGAGQQTSERIYSLEALGKLWLAGTSLDWLRFRPSRGPLPERLPLYPFQRQRYWIEPGEGRKAKTDRTAKQPLSQWFYTPSWERVAASATAPAMAPANWLLFSDSVGLADALAGVLVGNGHRVVRVRQGTEFIREAEDSYKLDAARSDRFTELLDLLKNSDRYPKIVVCLVNVTGQASPDPDPTAPFFGLMDLAAALGAQENECLLAVVTDGAQEVFGEQVRHPQKAMLSGVLKVLPQEHGQLRCRSVDLDPSMTSYVNGGLLYGELASTADDAVIAYRGHSRWVRTYRSVTIEEPTDHPRLKRGGTYLITGGLGGVGLSIAHHLALAYKANLALTSRTELPPRETWPTLTGPQAHLAKIIMSMEQAGARVLSIGADVSDEASMGTALARIRDRFGHIDGVIHAAGSPGGGAIVNRTRPDMRKVLAPKVHGTLVLDRLLADDPPDFLALFSSVNALLGGFGQADYAAANAFMDAFAQARTNRGTHVVSINWDSWREVGMAAAALHQRVTKAPAERPVGAEVTHPLLDIKLASKGATATFLSYFNVDRHWVLNEHWIQGEAILPGTAFLEMARAAHEEHTGQATLSFRDVTFLAPLVVSPGETRETRTVLERKGEYFSFQIASHRDDGQWWEHVTGQLFPVAEEARLLDLAAMKAEHALKEVDRPLDQSDLQGFHLEKKSRTLGDVTATEVPLTIITDSRDAPDIAIELGPRWHIASWVGLGEDSGLAHMNLAEELRGDLPHFKLHPALLDFAVGFLRLFKNQVNFLPLSYQRLILFQPLEPQFYSHIRFSKLFRRDRGNPIFDIVLLAEDGRELVRIEGFALGRIDGAQLEAHKKIDREKKARIAAATRSWITPEEGGAAHARALASVLSRVIVSTRDFGSRFEESLAGDSDLSGLHGDAVERPLHPRPDLMNPYVAPRNELESKLAEIWQKVIGLEQVGIYDDFNDLGGDSLLITRIHAQVKLTFTTELSVAELMQYPNVADLAAYMTKGDKPQASTNELQSNRHERQTRSRSSTSKLKAARRRNPLSRSGR